ncbi:MAG TPA: response regulator [Vicinamibacterales bacterium]|nr:response regulator [Vicinamibacterales bacterium]
MPTILIAEHDHAELARLSRLLRHAGHDPIGARSVDEAAARLSVIRPALLMAAVRLGGENGLQLLLRSRVTHPRMATLVTSDFPDPYLEDEARQYGAAAYLVKPLQPAGLLARVTEALAGVGRPRRWPRKRVPEGTAALIGPLTGELIDVSAGGLRFELPHEAAGGLPAVFTVRLPRFGTMLDVELVWTGRVTASGRMSAGVSLAPALVEDTRAWRALVNSLPDRPVPGDPGDPISPSPARRRWPAAVRR